MYFEISQPVVLNNLIHFKDHLSTKKGVVQGDKSKKRVYKVLLNTVTGELQFAQKIGAIVDHLQRSKSKSSSSNDWKEVYLLVGQPSKKDKPRFEICDLNQAPLKSTSINSMAWKIVNQTIQVLNLKGKEMRTSRADLLPEESILSDLSTIHLEETKQQIEDLPGWMGTLSREDAEAILDKRAVGTYLLRNGDEMDEAISLHFEEGNFIPIRPYLITYVGTEGKIVDLLILHTKKGWIIYQDEPNLKDPSYIYHPSPQSLIHGLTHLTKRPMQ